MLLMCLLSLAAFCVSDLVSLVLSFAIYKLHNVLLFCLTMLPTRLISLILVQRSQLIN
jgi:hypothetical protein